MDEGTRIGNQERKLIVGLVSGEYRSNTLNSINQKLQMRYGGMGET